MKIYTEKINKNVSVVKEIFFTEHCNCYIVEDEKDIIIIDFGVGGIKFSSIIDNFNDKNILSILTHFHFDHLLGIEQFETIYCSNLEPLDFGLKYLHSNDFEDKSFYMNKLASITSTSIKSLLETIKKKYLFEKDSIITSNFNFEIIQTPGHDSTSISLYEKNRKWLFCGDLLYDGELLVDLEDSDINDYINSLNKIKNLDVEYLFPGHNQVIKGEDIIQLLSNKIKYLKNHYKNNLEK